MADIDVYKEWLGIPEGDRPPDHYTLLRLVQFEDDVDKIQNNYRKLNAHVRKYATGQYLKQSQDLLNELAKAMLCLTDPDAKREYDASQGRESGGGLDDQPDTVLKFLVGKELIKQAQVEEIQRFAEARGLSDRDAVVQMKLVKSGAATQAYAAELRMPFIDLNDMLPEDDILDMLPKQVVKRHTCLPLFEDRGKVLVACADEPSPDLEDEIRMRYGMPMRAALAVPRSIQQAIARYYAPGERSEPQAAKSTGKNTKTAKPKPTKAKPAADPMSPEEQGKRQQISLIIICWSLIGTIMGLNLSGAMAGNTFGLVGSGLLVAGIVAGVLKLTYWK
ncbi:MAG: general secretion pathway protein GspE [Planctomycetaceae bacterium]|nr:general secretion pathway protein GspE [Planctomycetaceae bacterium]